ncbi:MAG: hypothetical protein K8F58_19755 [Bauldia sp.]|nr:hypothetical protein [Bauldia sp.]
MPFETSVFLNCPFDDEYLPLLRPILFAIIDLGFTPRIALESLDSGKPRIEKIISLIEASKYAVHDLSRSQARAPGEYYRLNMPFELGLDVGCRLFRSDIYAEKKCLVLEAEPFRYQAALSDLSGSDIAVHNNDPTDALSGVRNWLNTAASLRAPGPTAIWNRFSDFMAGNYDLLKARGYSDEDIKRLPVPELIDDMQRWIAKNRT